MPKTVKPRQEDKITVFNDPIHGHISLPQKCVDIINTPEFLRLRHIKQLGATYEVFPGAAHNRFEHCIGVAHLAGEFAKFLQHQINEELKNKGENKGEGGACNTTAFTEDMRITNEDIICLQVAGLCHDLGHGPMSHVFETRFAKEFNPEWEHAEVSCKLFDQLIKNNKENRDKQNENKVIEFSEKDQAFIKRLIHKPKNDNLTPEERKAADEKAYSDTGRPAAKNFLYQIVSNDDNGIDVDKFDYFARDCYQLGFKNNFDHKRLMTFSRVVKVGNEWHICYRDKQVEDIYHMFLSRVILHRRACQHKTVSVLERMYMEALSKANDSYRLRLRNGYFKISETLNEDKTDLYVKLTDHVFNDIRNFPNTDSNKDLADAQKILDRIETRDLYKLVGEAIPESKKDGGQPKFELKGKDEEDEETIIKGVVKYSKDSEQLKEEDLFVDITNFNYGKKDQNPVDSVYFYNKPTDGSYQAFHIKRIDVSSLLPDVYAEKHIRLYVRESKNLDKARKCFISWCKDNGLNGKWKHLKEANVDTATDAAV